MIDYIRIIKEAEKHQKMLVEKGFDDLNLRVISIDLGRQSGKSYSMRKLVEEAVKHGDKALMLCSKFDSVEDCKSKLNEESKSSCYHIDNVLENPSLAKNSRFVILENFGMHKDDVDKSQKLVELIRHKNVGLVILAGRVIY